MDQKTRRELKELPRLSQIVLNNLTLTMKALAQVSTDSPEFNSALKNSKAANKEADNLLKKQRDVIRAIKR
jgi:hypothetical protein